MTAKLVFARLRSLELDTIGSAIVFALAVLLFPLRFFVSSIYIQTIPVVIGVASGLHLLLRDHEGVRHSFSGFRTAPGTAHLLQASTYVGLAGMVFVGTYTGGRTLPFYGLAVGVSALVFAQIFFVSDSVLRPLPVLGQVVALSLVVRFVGLAATPGYVGIDAWVHLTDYAAAIRRTGDLAAISDVKYYGAPLYHLLVVVVADTFDTTLRTALYVTLGVGVSLVLPLVYYVTRLFLSVRWALFAALAYAIADHVVRWGLHVIPTSMGLLFFLGVFYVVGRIYTARRPYAMYALAVFFGVAALLTHQISMFIVLVFLGAGTVAQAIFRVYVPAGTDTSRGVGRGAVNFAALFAILLPLTLLDWHLSPPSGTSFLAGTIQLAERSASGAGLLNLASAQPVPTAPSLEALLVQPPLWFELLDVTGVLLLLLIALLGAFALLERAGIELLSFTWMLSAGLMLLVTFGLPLLGLYFFVPGRWYAFLYLPLVVLGAFGMRHVELAVSPRYLVVALVAFSLVASASMLMAPSATRDSPVADDYQSRFAFTEAEQDAAATISTIHPATEPIATDHPYWLLFRDRQRQSAEFLALEANGTTSNDQVVYREYQTSGSVKAEVDGTVVRVTLPAETVCRPSMNVLYANDEVHYCREDLP